MDLSFLEDRKMRIPNQSVGVRRTVFSITTGARGEPGIKPQRLYCSTGPCINGRRLHVCIREVIRCIPGSPGSPELGIPPSPPHCSVSDYEITHFHYHPCVGGFRLPDLPVSVRV